MTLEILFCEICNGVAIEMKEYKKFEGHALSTEKKE